MRIGENKGIYQCLPVSIFYFFRVIIYLTKTLVNPNGFFTTEMRIHRWNEHRAPWMKINNCTNVKNCNI